MPLLSVIIPVYNEEKTIAQILDVINSIEIEKEIIVVDDASSDKTREILSKIDFPGLKVFFHDNNRGKGAAFRTGLAQAIGDIIIIQDADLEYNPRDYFKLVQPVLDNQADLVLGNRFVEEYKGLVLHQMGNRFLTGMINLLYGTKITDTHTCYKVARREIFNNFNIQANDFSLEQEIIVKAVKRGLRICEVPVEYRPRGYAEGKKIRVWDAVKIITEMLVLRFSDRRKEKCLKF